VGVPLTPLRKVVPDAVGVRVRLEVCTEPRGVQAKFGGVLQQILILERRLVLEEGGMHLEEPPLRGGGFGRFSGPAGVRMHIVEWEVAEDEAQVVGQDPLELLHGGDRPAAVGTLVIAVLDQCHDRGRWPPNVVALAHGDGQAGGLVRSDLSSHDSTPLRMAGSRDP
jgi:hypothetical protein